jgi:hypothetical protein
MKSSVQLALNNPQDITSTCHYTNIKGCQLPKACYLFIYQMRIAQNPLERALFAICDNSGKNWHNTESSSVEFTPNICVL